MHAGRTVTGMTTGAEETTYEKPQRRRWDFTLSTWPVRLIYALVVGTAVNLAVGSTGLGTSVALGFFAVTTVIMWALRQRQPGTDVQP